MRMREKVTRLTTLITVLVEEEVLVLFSNLFAARCSLYGCPGIAGAV